MLWPWFGGTCSGPRRESSRCNLKSCCRCGSWSSWGRCEGSCLSGGTQSRRRSCRSGECDTEESRSCTTEPCTVTTKCRATRTRKNVNSLSGEERSRLVSALRASIGRGEYQKVGNYHGAPENICGGQSCCPHRDIGFLPWHRLYMVHMEEELPDGYQQLSPPPRTPSPAGAHSAHHPSPPTTRRWRGSTQSCTVQGLED